MQWSHIWLTKEFWHSTGECSVQKPLGIFHTDVQISQQHPGAHYSYHEMKLQGVQRTFLCGSQWALQHSCSSDAPYMNRGTCVIWQRMLQENAVVTAQLMYPPSVSVWKRQSSFFKSKIFIIVPVCPSRILPPRIWIFMKLQYRDLMILPTDSITTCQMLAFSTVRISRHRLTPVLQLIDFKLKHTWFHAKDLVEVYVWHKQASWKGPDASTELTRKSHKDRLHSPSWRPVCLLWLLKGKEPESYLKSIFH